VINLALWISGVVLLAVAVASVRQPLARIRELDATDANLRRYEDWRGGRRTAVPRAEVTGADILRAHLRGRLTRWAIVGAVGVALIVAGFAVR
jgi:hypothetical protein